MNTDEKRQTMSEIAVQIDVPSVPQTWTTFHPSLATAREYAADMIPRLQFRVPFSQARRMYLNAQLEGWAERVRAQDTLGIVEGPLGARIIISDNAGWEGKR